MLPKYRAYTLCFGLPPPALRTVYQVNVPKPVAYPSRSRPPDQLATSPALRSLFQTQVLPSFARSYVPSPKALQIRKRDKPPVITTRTLATKIFRKTDINDTAGTVPQLAGRASPSLHQPPLGRPTRLITSRGLSAELSMSLST